MSNIQVVILIVVLLKTTIKIKKHLENFIFTNLLYKLLIINYKNRKIW